MFHSDIKTLVKENTNFREVLYTGKYSQLVIMNIPAGSDIGEEIHEKTDQIFYIVDGEGEAVIGEERRGIEEHDGLFIPAGTKHNIINTGDEDLKLFTVYAPTMHPDGTVHKTKEEAQKSE